MFKYISHQFSFMFRVSEWVRTALQKLIHWMMRVRIPLLTFFYIFFLELDMHFFIDLKNQFFGCHCILLLCVQFIVPLENFSLIWRRHHCRCRAANFDLCSALMAIEQWGFFNVPHLLWHGPTLYNGHLRGPATPTPLAERLAVELSLPVFTTRVCRDRASNPVLPHARRTL